MRARRCDRSERCCDTQIHVHDTLVPTSDYLHMYILYWLGSFEVENHATRDFESLPPSTQRARAFFLVRGAHFVLRRKELASCMYRERLNVVHFRAVRRNLRGKVPGCRATSDAPSGGFYSYRFRQ